VICLCCCQKYEEGPKVSFVSSEKVIAHHWKIDSYTVDGADSMQLVKDLHLQGIFIFNPYGASAETNLNIVTVEDDSTYSYEGKWTNNKKTEELTLSIHSLVLNNNRTSYELPTAPLFGNSVDNWKIVRLRHRQDMWLRLTKNSKEYQLRFKPN
jgi:hypothetical protein